LIHAGKSRQWLEIEQEEDGEEFDGTYDVPLSAMAFGAFVGVAELAGCFELRTYRNRHGGIVTEIPTYYRRRFPWLDSHQHVEGKFCWVLEDVRRFEEPIPYRGKQGLFEVHGNVTAKAMKTTKAHQ